MPPSGAEIILKICRFERPGSGPTVGFIAGGHVVDLSLVQAVSPSLDVVGLLAVLRSDIALAGVVAAAIEDIDKADLIPLAGVRLLAPINAPGKIIGVGRNYGAHVAEAGLARTEVPKLFFKFANAVVGPNEPVIRPSHVKKLDYEVELCVVMGKRCKNVNVEHALGYVGGYMVLNDISAREFQFDMGAPMTSFAKGMDTFCPTGPWLVTADEIEDPSSLRLRCWVNGELRQDDRTSQMIYDVPHLISFISESITLEPGDCIATGTPAGVGASHVPPVWLQAGDEMRLEVEGIGVLTNTVAIQ